MAGKKISRNTNQRKSLFRSLINELIIRGRIETTESKAKAVRGLTEKLITKGKNGTLHARRIIGAFLQNKLAVKKIVEDLGPIFRNRPGGYTRITRLGSRLGDNAPVVRLELLENPSSKTSAEKNSSEKKILSKKHSKKNTKQI